MKKFLSVTLFALSFAAGRLWADIAVSAAVSQAEVGLGQQFVFEVTVSGDQGAPEPQLGSMPDFQVASKGVSQNISVMNGAMSVSKAYSFVLIPAKEGTFTIPPATVSYKDQTYQTAPIEIKVVPADQAPQQQAQQSADPFEQFFGASPFQRQEPRINAMVRVVPSRQKVYVNEEVTLTQKLFYNGNVSLVDVQFMPVDSTGFWKEFLWDGRWRSEGKQLINGVNYDVLRAGRFVLYPLLAGKKTIPSFKGAIAVQGGFNRWQKVLASEPVEITVLPLPPGKPPGFDGAVGQYTLAASVDKRSVKQNDAILLRVVVNGRGNVKSVGQLVQPDLGSFKIYKSTSSVKTDPQDGYITGRKAFEYILIPLQAGKLTIPSFRFAYFDPGREAYRTVATDPIRVDVAPVSENEKRSVRLPPEQVDIRLLNKDIRYIKTSGSLRPRVRLDRSAAVRILFALELLALAGLLALKFVYFDRLRNDTGFRRKSQAYAKFRKAYLRMVKDLTTGRPSADRLVSELETVVTAYAADKLNIPGSELTLENLQSALKSRQLSDSVVARYTGLLEEVQMLKYTPVKGRDRDAVRKIVEEIGRVVDEMEQEKFA